MSTPTYRLGLVLVTASAVAWSTAGLFSRLISVDSWTLVAWRGMFGALGVLLVIAALQRRGVMAQFRQLGWKGWLMAANGAIGMTFFVTALRHTSVAHVAVIYATVPFTAAAAGWLMLREAPARDAVVASLAALAGVVVMVGFGTDGGWFGDLLAFGMTISMATFMVMARAYPQIPAMPAACLSALLSGLVALPMSTSGALTPWDLLLLALFGLTNSAAGLALFTLGARHLPAIETALIGSLDAPLAPLWVFLAFGEVPGASTLAGGAIVFVAVVAHIVVGSLRADAGSGVPSVLGE